MVTVHIWVDFLLATQLLFATCLTETDVKTNVCWAVCRTQGFDTGYYEKKSDSCICGQRKKYSEITDKSILIVPRKSDDKNSFTQYDY